jgi:hypothetical protein
VYLTIAIDEHVVGSMLFVVNRVESKTICFIALFQLYNDVVPITCENFFNRCTEKSQGYKGTRIHRYNTYSLEGVEYDK